MRRRSGGSPSSCSPRPRSRRRRSPRNSPDVAAETRRSTLILPGLLPPDPFLETYLVRPGGATVFVLGPDGRDDAAALGAKADAPATVLRAAVGSRTGNGFVGELADRGLNPAEATAVQLFGEWSPPGASQSFLAARPVTVVVAAPG